MLRKVFLYGDLGAEFGRQHEFDVSNIYDVPKALACNYAGFSDKFINGAYRVVIGNKKTGTELSDETLSMNLGKSKHIHIIPVPNGAKSQGSKAIMMIVLGAAMMGPFGLAALGAGATTMAGAVTAAGGIATQAALMGVSFALIGVSTLLTPSPKVDDYTNRETDQKNSFLFNGPVNTATQGQCIPVVYGTFLAGTTVVSSGMTAEIIDVPLEMPTYLRVLSNRIHYYWGSPTKDNRVDAFDLSYLPFGSNIWVDRRITGNELFLNPADPWWTAYQINWRVRSVQSSINKTSNWLVWGGSFG